MRRIAPLFSSILVLAACGGTDPGPVPAAVPSEAVVRWFEAVEEGDLEEADVTTIDDGLVIVLALENGMEPSEVADLLALGVPDDVADRYWASFRDGFASFAGRPLSTLRVGDHREFDSQGGRYAAVTVLGRGDAEATVFTKLESDGGWAVDLVATLGSGFLSVMGRTYDSLPADEDGDAVRAAFREVVAPSLWATLAGGDPTDDYTRDALGLLERIDAG